jgi:hypothetical protein
MIRMTPIKVAAVLISIGAFAPRRDFRAKLPRFLSAFSSSPFIPSPTRSQRPRHAIGPSLADDDGHDRVQPGFTRNNAHRVRRFSATCSSSCWCGRSQAWGVFRLIRGIRRRAGVASRRHTPRRWRRGFALTIAAAGATSDNALAVPNRCWQNRAERSCGDERCRGGDTLRRTLTIVCVSSAWIVAVSLAQAAATRAVQIGVIDAQHHVIAQAAVLLKDLKTTKIPTFVCSVDWSYRIPPGGQPTGTVKSGHGSGE